MQSTSLLVSEVRTPDVIESMNLQSIKNHEEEPFCPQCGSMCTLKSRQGLWECCTYSITTKSWDVVRLHAGLLERVLIGAGVSQITYHDVPIEIEHAVSPSHLLCLFLIQAQDIGAAVGMEPLLVVEPIEDDNVGEALLMPYTISINMNGCKPHESLHLLASAARLAVDNLREVDETGSILDFKHITQNDPDMAVA